MRETRANETATGALLHDDDCWDPEFLERRVAFLREHPQCGLVSPHQVGGLRRRRDARSHTESRLSPTARACLSTLSATTTDIHG
jgi:hypothetical protein